MKIKNTTNNALQDSLQNLYQSFNQDEEAQEKAVGEYSVALADYMKDEIKSEVRLFEDRDSTERILAERGTRKMLTPKEKRFFSEAVEKQHIDNLDETFPTTIIEDIMQGLVTEHPVLSEIDTQYTEAAIKYIYGDPINRTAYWDVIPADIRQILIGTFKVLDMTVSKLSGFIALPKGYFELGASWLANYVITFLRETMTATLEQAVVNGDGYLKPIGLTRKLSGAIDNVYPQKDTVKITEYSPIGLAGAKALLAKNQMITGQLSLVVNPVTYETVIAANSWARNEVTKQWYETSIPNLNIVQSYAMPENLAVLGDLKNYLLAVAGDLSINLYDQTLAIEDMDLYVGKMFAAGLPKNPNAFVLLDLSDIEGVVVPEDEAEAELVRVDSLNPRKNSGSHALTKEGEPTKADIGTGTGGRGVNGTDAEDADPVV